MVSDDLVRVRSPGALVGGGAPVVTVHDDHVPLRQRGPDGTGDVHFTVFAKKFQFRLQREASFLCRAAKFAAPLEAGGLFGDDAGDAAFTAILGKERSDRGLAGTVD